MATKLFDPTGLPGNQETQGFLTSLLEASTEYAIIGTDLDGKILLWNEGARRLYDYQAQEVVGHGNAEILHTTENGSGSWRDISYAVFCLEKRKGIAGRVRKDGQRQPTRLVLTPR